MTKFIDFFNIRLLMPEMGNQAESLVVVTRAILVKPRGATGVKILKAVSMRVSGLLAVLGLATACGDVAPTKTKAAQSTKKLSLSTQKQIQNTFKVTKPGVTTMSLSTQERD